MLETYRDKKKKEKSITLKWLLKSIVSQCNVNNCINLTFQNDLLLQTHTSTSTNVYKKRWNCGKTTCKRLKTRLSLTLYVNNGAVPNCSEIWRWEENLDLTAIEVCVFPSESSDDHIHSSRANIPSAVNSAICCKVGLREVDKTAADLLLAV